MIPSLTSQFTVVYNRNRESDDIHVDDNGFPVRPALLGQPTRPRDYDVVDPGYNADGHVGRLNLTASAYAALGEDRNSFFTGEKADIRAFFGAAELSYDKDWMRFRLSGLYASGAQGPLRRQGAGLRRGLREPSSPGPTPATGSARRSPSPAADARSRSTGATAFSTRCGPRKKRDSRTSTTP